MDMSTAKNLAIVAVLLGTAYLAYVNRKRLLRLLVLEQGKKLTRKEYRHDAMTDVCKEFLMCADNFQGIFETMYKASVGSISPERIRNVLLEWNIRMGGIAQASISLRSWWATVIADFDNLSDEELRERAKRIVQMVLSSGIIRDDRKEMVAVQDTTMYYQNSDEGEWDMGQQLHIESPCWYLPSSPARIIEKGYCVII